MILDPNEYLRQRLEESGNWPHPSEGAKPQAIMTIGEDEEFSEWWNYVRSKFGKNLPLWWYWYKSDEDFDIYQELMDLTEEYNSVTIASWENESKWKDFSKAIQYEEIANYLKYCDYFNDDKRYVVGILGTSNNDILYESGLIQSFPKDTTVVVTDDRDVLLGSYKFDLIINFQDGFNAWNYRSGYLIDCTGTAINWTKEESCNYKYIFETLHFLI